MRRFWSGMLSGVILSVPITLVIVWTFNDERRRQLRYRVEKLQHALPSVEQLKQSAQEVASKARETGSDLSEQVQTSAGKLVHHTQEILSTLQQQAPSRDKKQETKSTV